MTSSLGRPVRTHRKHHGRPGPRPQTWCTGTDPVRHDQYVAWGRARAQALYRGEGWALTFAEFEQLWQGAWHLRGRASQELCMTRTDPDLAWMLGNIELITRADHNRRQAAMRTPNR